MHPGMPHNLNKHLCSKINNKSHPKGAGAGRTTTTISGEGGNLGGTTKRASKTKGG